MSTIAAKWYIRQAEMRAAQQRVESATREFQRRPTDENFRKLEQAKQPDGKA